MKNINKLFGIILVLMLCASIGFSQTTLTVYVLNSTTSDYHFQCKFKADGDYVYPTSGSTMMDVDGEDEGEEELVFSETGVTLYSINALLEPSHDPPAPTLFAPNFNGNGDVAPCNMFCNEFYVTSISSSLYTFRVDEN
ncbi:MAG: hypothetical protein HN704_11910 [Bacteroidetes bacterium]|jgi:hypothetical protein|nr:hypothetical protein [Bacteroidota bacterium]MBT6685586.1 hypothetical protein [Bacteroidota bacterium]MBT7144474.1 hypothetical protein [Bacteroidota bacterium]MBT7492296.1 hypothetical protein [Bacteroidota bacterium]